MSPISGRALDDDATIAIEELLTDALEIAVALDERVGVSCAGAELLFGVIEELLAGSAAEQESETGEDELFGVSLDVSEVGTVCEESLDCFVGEVSVGVVCFESLDLLCSIDEDDSSLI